ncbi:MAG: DNA methyltransferase [Xenococcaceae cyanobacterium]
MSSQTAQFIFKLRHNISLTGDVILAEMELKAFLSESSIEGIQKLQSLVKDELELAKLRDLIALDTYAREVGLQGYKARGSLENLPSLVKYLSFVQTIYCIVKDSEQVRLFIHDCKEKLGSVLEYQLGESCLIIYAVPHYALIEISDVVARRAKNAIDTKTKLQMMLDGLLARTTNSHALKIAEEALSSKNTTSHLSHDIHYYKAKFFPRLVRSTLNICRQRLGEGSHRVIDCFSGSGTTMLEAAMLGMQSVGTDIDPLSVLIAQSKIDILHVPSSYLEGEVSLVLEALTASQTKQLNLFSIGTDQQYQNNLKFPAWLMKNRNMTQEVADELVSQIQKLRYAISFGSPELRGFFQVLMSDAITRKIKMRFLGTGVGRFSLTFTKRCPTENFRDSAQKYIRVVATIEWLKKAINLTFFEAQSISADARSINENLGLFDILVTSPPYLPAASGRESYAKARAPSLIALGIKNHEDVDDLVDDSVGSMHHTSVDLACLSDREKDIVEWLKHDDLRKIKAAPTACYFLDMRKAFKQMYQYLRSGALAVIVSGKQSTFYQFSTRKELYVVKSAEILAEEAQAIGFVVESLHDIQLQKSNKNARPRSLDDYYETLIYLRKP